MSNGKCSREASCKQQNKTLELQNFDKKICWLIWEIVGLQLFSKKINWEIEDGQLLSMRKVVIRSIETKYIILLHFEKVGQQMPLICKRGRKK